MNMMTMLEANKTICGEQEELEEEEAGKEIFLSSS